MPNRLWWGVTAINTYYMGVFMFTHTHIYTHKCTKVELNNLGQPVPLKYSRMHLRPIEMKPETE